MNIKNGLADRQLSVINEKTSHNYDDAVESKSQAICEQDESSCESLVRVCPNKDDLDENHEVVERSLINLQQARPQITREFQEKSFHMFNHFNIAQTQTANDN